MPEAIRWKEHLKSSKYTYTILYKSVFKRIIPPFFSIFFLLSVFLFLFYLAMNVSVTCFSFLEEMQIYSFVNMTDIMRLPMLLQAQIKRLPFEFSRNSILIPLFILILTLFLFYLLFFSNRILFPVSIVCRDNNIPKHT